MVVYRGFSLRRLVAAALIAAALPGMAAAQMPDGWPDLRDWPAIATAAHDQTVRLALTGDGTADPDFLEWAATELQARFGVRLDLVELPSDMAALEALRGEEPAPFDLAAVGSVAVARARMENLLPGRFAFRLPNWQFVDVAKHPSLLQAAGLPTRYGAVPLGLRRVTLYANTRATSARPDTPEAILTYARANPGRFAIVDPAAPDGEAFLEEMLFALADDPSLLQAPVKDADAEAVAQPLMDWLDTIRPLLWQEGQAFPANGAEARRLLAEGSVDMIADFDPLPGGAGSPSADGGGGEIAGFGLAVGGMVDAHFLLIDRDTPVPAAALVVADFLMSPQAQIRKADPALWGDASVLALSALPAEDAARLRQAMAPAIGFGPRDIAIPRPHISWIDWLRPAVAARLSAQ
ncbi:ABC transporter substrate-binding protein [Aureimonas frigidaquae]|uniref:ABC transporter substrate-binding protein n=1 Tax=Aureimonas frigidaquae TaxID=424757 RepID=A0A0P0Z160_9HYPH|nr:ABC transporter substrate-binding protein [Aureimonas frigidaquae]BAT27653.1 hypothetical protein [Aureimonas frigidaquae]